MKKINYFIFSLIASIFMIGAVNANSISKITMDIYVDKNGDAKIQEVWTAKTDKGTEGYHPYFNIGDSVITIDSVTDDKGNKYTEQKWNVKDSFQEKAKKYGIYKDGNEVDICWGITEYGRRTYTINYTIKNFIYNTSDDQQILFWTLIPKEMSDKPQIVYINIHSDERYSDDLPVWGFGNKGGTAYVYDGYIEMQTKTDKSLDTKEYMTILVQFPKGYFNTTAKINKTWEQVLKEAEEGSSKYNEFLDNLIGFLASIIPFVFFILVFIFAAKSSGSTNKFKNKVMPKNKDTLPFRDLPCKDDYFLAYLIANEYGLTRQKTDFLGALLLKWIKNGNVEVTTEEKGIFKTKSTKILLKLQPEEQMESDMFNMMKTAAKDEILESNEFKRYCSSHYSRVLDWFDKALDSTFNNIKDNNEYASKEIKKGLFGESYIYTATDKTNELGKFMLGLKKFFKEFTQMHDKKAIEVKMWRDYLIYAQILGMAKEVAKEFKDLYPDMITDNDYNSIILIHDFSTTSVSAASAARSRAQSYSSGGGGFSSGGGGGGSFGGGGGGGGFR